MEISLKTTTDYGLNARTGVNLRAFRSVSQDSKINSASSEMESLFIQNMFKEMRASVPKGGMTSGGRAEEMFTEMLDAELAKAFSTSGGIGLSTMVRKQLEAVPEIGNVNPGK